jgi:hypothetical protein
VKWIQVFLKRPIYIVHHKNRDLMIYFCIHNPLYIQKYKYIYYFCLYLYMTERYFYKGIPLNDLISNGNEGNPTTSQTTNIGGFNSVPGIFTDGKAFSQIQTTGFTNSDGIDIGKSYTAFYQTTNVAGTKQINLAGTIQKTTYDTISAVLIGASGGGGGGGGSGFENTVPSGTQPAWAGNGGAGGGLSIFNRTSISAFNQLDIFVGSAGAGGAGGPHNPNGTGTRGQDGQAGQFSRLICQNGTQSVQTTQAFGGGGGFGGNPGNQSSAAVANTQIAVGGQGTADPGDNGGLANVRNVPGVGGRVGSQTLYPTITSLDLSGGFGGGIFGPSGQGISGAGGSNGRVRVYFFKS